MTDKEKLELAREALDNLQWADFHGCIDGDCPHEEQLECFKALCDHLKSIGKQARESLAQISADVRVRDGYDLDTECMCGSEAQLRDCPKCLAEARDGSDGSAADRTAGLTSGGVQDHSEQARSDDCHEVGGDDRAREAAPVESDGAEKECPHCKGWPEEADGSCPCCVERLNLVSAIRDLRSELANAKKRYASVWRQERSACEEWDKECNALEKERDALRAELDTERMRLAACGVAALANTEQTAKEQRIGRDNPYWSASYGDVCNIVDSEMALRARLAEVEGGHICYEYTNKDGSTETVVIPVKDAGDVLAETRYRAEVAEHKLDEANKALENYRAIYRQKGVKIDEVVQLRAENERLVQALREIVAVGRDVPAWIRRLVDAALAERKGE